MFMPDDWHKKDGFLEELCIQNQRGNLADGAIKVCPECNGEGRMGSGVMSHAVNTATIDPPWELPMTCPTCGGGGYIEGESEPRTFDDLEQEDAELAF